MTLDNDIKSVIIECMEDEKRYTIDELTVLTGFSRRTIRFYVEKGLVEPPAGRGMGGFYGRSQLEALRRIGEARKAGRSLASIGRMAGNSAASLPASAQGSKNLLSGTAAAEPRRILRWEVVPGIAIEASETAAMDHQQLLAALLEAAGLRKEEYDA
jgi:DNA-binding transcriptional MerR regulator